MKILKILKKNKFPEKLTLILMLDYLILFSMESILPGSVIEVFNFNWLLVLIIILLILLNGHHAINNLFFQTEFSDDFSSKNSTSKNLPSQFLNNWMNFSTNQTTRTFRSSFLKNLFITTFLFIFFITSFFILLGNTWWKEIFYLLFILLICLVFYKIIIKK